jgi:peptide/nickel transport system substrate-binding protein
VGVVLVACTSQTNLVAGSQVVVALTAPFTSVNPDTSFGRGSQTNADVAMLTSTGFGRGALRLPDRSMY